MPTVTDMCEYDLRVPRVPKTSCASVIAQRRKAAKAEPSKSYIVRKQELLVFFDGCQCKSAGNCWKSALARAFLRIPACRTSALDLA